MQAPENTAPELSPEEHAARVHQLHERITDALLSITALFRPGALVTLIVRHRDDENMQLVMSSETSLAGPLIALQSRAAQEAIGDDTMPPDELAAGAQPAALPA